MTRASLGGWMLVVLGCVCLVLIWHGWAPSDREAAQPSRPPLAPEVAPSGQRQGVPRDHEALEQVTVAVGSTGHEASDSRRTPASERRGLVVTESGTPVVGAQVSLTWPTDERINLNALEQARRWPELAGVSTTTDETGRFLLGVEADDDRVTVLWVTALGYRAEHRVLEPGQSTDLGFTLASAGGLEVTVVDGELQPVSGAEVVSLLHDHQVGEPATATQALARAALVRVARTDDRGRCLLPAFPGEQTLRAFAQEAVSAPWTGRAPREVRLVLHPSFRASGRVLAGAGDLQVAEMKVSAHSVIAGRKRELDRVQVASDGSWGPLVLPVSDAQGLLFRLEGGRAIPIEERRPMARVGEHLTVDFQPMRGIFVFVQTQDADENPVAGAQVMLWWREESDWNLGEDRTDSAGIALVDAIRPGDIWIRIKAPGFLEFNYGPLRIEEQSSAPFLIDLLPAGTVTGRVLANGEPVPEFRVTYFGAQAKSPTTVVVVDEPQGEFEIREAPLGPTVWIAAAAGYTPSEPFTLEVEPGVDAALELHLRPARAGLGIVVDALSGRPVEGARIESWIEFDSRWLAGTRIDDYSDGEGKFVFPALRPEGDHLDVRADGYGPRRVSIPPGSEDPADLGTIALAPAQPLKVLLIAEGLDPTLCRARLIAQREHPWQAFDPRGVVEFEGVVGGHVEVWVQAADGIEIREDAYLTHGEEWLVRVEVENPAHSGLEVILDEQARDRSDLRVRSMTSLGLDRIRQRLVTVRDGRALIPGPLGEEVTLEVETDLLELLCVRHVRSEALKAGRVELTLEAREQRLRIVDRGGEPLPRVTATLTLRDDRSHWRSQRQTDAEGRVRFLVPPNEQVLLHLRPALGGGMTDIALPAASDEEYEVVLDAAGALDLEIHDGDTPLSGVVVSLLSASGFRFASLDATDAHGRARYESLASGAYVAEVAPPGAWGRYVPIEVRAGRSWQRIDLRRLGALALEVRSSLGAAVANASVHLESVELGEPVADWIAQGRVRNPVGGLRTDSQGHLRVLALPNGPYRYHVTTPDGRGAQGQLVVPAHAEGVVTVVVE